MVDKDSLLKYGGILGRRFKAKEKLRFLAAIAADFKEAGYGAQLSYHQKGRRKLANLYLGDCVQAKTLVVCNYDTPLRKFFLHRPYVPFSYSKQAKENQSAQLVPLLVLALVGLAGFGLFGLPVLSDHHFNGWDVAVLACLLGLTLALAILSNGVGNRVNFNRNTSAVLVCLGLAQQLQGDRDVAFVLTDDGCRSVLGDEMIRLSLPTTLDQKRVIKLEPVGVGNHCVIHCRQANMAFAQRLLAALPKNLQGEILIFDDSIPSSAQLYKQGIVLACGSMDQGELVIMNSGTPKDAEVNINQIMEIERSLFDIIR